MGNLTTQSDSYSIGGRNPNQLSDGNKGMTAVVCCLFYFVAGIDNSV